ncbi:hypothetical protein PVAP13_1KG054185 [Panicum virgatum]|uniref:Uncharacterized protein n=1 Tax=Panicum virgatum TaxID=38727 RepID=A0A8T0X9J2_PANVG|nr:hypothetical protein PVAP13_1KG054185 [Panicum virgatum]
MSSPAHLHDLTRWVPSAAQRQGARHRRASPGRPRVTSSTLRSIE